MPLEACHDLPLTGFHLVPVCHRVDLVGMAGAVDKVLEITQARSGFTRIPFGRIECRNPLEGTVCAAPHLCLQDGSGGLLPPPLPGWIHVRKGASTGT